MTCLKLKLFLDKKKENTELSNFKEAVKKIINHKGHCETGKLRLFKLAFVLKIQCIPSS